MDNLISTMSLDKFGRSRSSNERIAPVIRLPFSFNAEGNIDFKGLKVCNVKDPTSSTDVANKMYVDKKIQTDLKGLKEAVDIHLNKQIGNIELKFNGLLMAVNELQNSYQQIQTTFTNNQKFVEENFGYVRNEVKTALTHIKQEIIQLEQKENAAIHSMKDEIKTVLNTSKDDDKNKFESIKRTLADIKLGLQRLNNDLDEKVDSIKNDIQQAERKWQSNFERIADTSDI